MANPSGPSGTERNDGEDAEQPFADDSDPVTEVIDVAGEPGQSGADGAGERRYTAPGFDAGSTQIIDRVDDHPTEFIGAPTEVLAADTAQRPRTAPQAIAPRRGGRRRWITPAIMVLAAVLVAAAVGALLVKRSHDARVSRENQVRSSIETFDDAVQQGDLATLRSITCGQTRDTYVNYDDQTWTDVYAKVLAAKQYPVVASIDEVVVDGDHAEANVTSYMAFDPATTSTRSFDLQFRDDQWKICQSS